MFIPSDGAEQKWSYDNSVNVYNGSTENIELLISLSQDMPEGEYRLMMFENGHEDNPFKLMDGDDGIITVLPPSAVPVMRMTQDAIWRNATDTEDRKSVV